MPDKVDFMIRDKKKHNGKVSIHQEYVAALIRYVPNNTWSKDWQN